MKHAAFKLWPEMGAFGPNLPAPDPSSAMGDEGEEGGTGVSGAEGQREGSVLLCELLESAAVFWELFTYS